MSARPFTSALSRRSFLRLATGITAGVAVGEVAYGGFYARHHLDVVRQDLWSPTVPAPLDGLRIGLITDTHYSNYTSLEFIASAVDLIGREAPDLIVLGGDYVTRRNRLFIPEAATPFKALSAPLGVFGVLGNHDDDVEVPRVLRRNGVQVLKDARTRLRVRGETLDLAGVRYWTWELADLARITRGRAPLTLLLAHDPRRYREAATGNRLIARSYSSANTNRPRQRPASRSRAKSWSRMWISTAPHRITSKVPSSSGLAS